MADQPLVIQLDVETFLRWEEAQPDRHELLDGFVFAFAGGDVAHAVIAANVIALLVAAVERPCRVFTADAQVVSRLRSATYADGGVTSEDPLDAPVVRKPVLLVEVVSESSQRRDRVDKRAIYHAIDSLRSYVLVDRTRRLIEGDERGDGDGWATSTTMQGTAYAMGIALPLEAVYAGTPLETADAQ